jgi:hypothetical protein
MSTATTAPTRPPVFDLGAFLALTRAMHPERRFPSAVSRLVVDTMDREPDSSTAWVFGAYAHILGRIPDRDGHHIHEAYLRNGGTPADLVARLSASSEAADTAPDAEIDFDELFVTGCYLVALGRRPDSAGLEVQRQALVAGTRHEDLLRALIRSPEAESKLRFPPAPPSWDQELARAVQELVAGDVDQSVQHLLVQAVRDGRSPIWLVRTAIKLRLGRKAFVRQAPQWWLLAQLAVQRAEHSVLVTGMQSSTAWTWRVQQQLMSSMGDLRAEVRALGASADRGEKAP